MSLVSKLSHVALNSVAYFLIEPRLKSGEWEIRKATLDKLRPELDSLFVVYEKAKIMFRDIDVCEACGGDCCTGSYNRFSVFDHVVHLLAGLQTAPEWNYKLHPFKSYAVNRIDGGICANFIPGKGCGFTYQHRPAVCVFWICDKIKVKMTPENYMILSETRRGIDRFQWKVVFALILGGMKRVVPSD